MRIRFTPYPWPLWAKFALASNLFIVGGMSILLWIDWRIMVAIFLLGVAKILDEKSDALREVPKDE